MACGEGELSSLAKGNVEHLRGHLSDDPVSLTSHQVGQIMGNISCPFQYMKCLLVLNALYL